MFRLRWFGLLSFVILLFLSSVTCFTLVLHSLSLSVSLSVCVCESPAAGKKTAKTEKGKKKVLFILFFLEVELVPWLATENLFHLLFKYESQYSSLLPHLI